MLAAAIVHTSDLAKPSTRPGEGRTRNPKAFPGAGSHAPRPRPSPRGRLAGAGAHWFLARTQSLRLANSSESSVCADVHPPCLTELLHARMWRVNNTVYTNPCTARYSTRRYVPRRPSRVNGERARALGGATHDSSELKFAVTQPHLSRGRLFDGATQTHLSCTSLTTQSF